MRYILALFFVALLVGGSAVHTATVNAAMEEGATMQEESAAKMKMSETGHAAATKKAKATYDAAQKEADKKYVEAVKAAGKAADPAKARELAKKSMLKAKADAKNKHESEKNAAMKEAQKKEPMKATQKKEPAKKMMKEAKKKGMPKK